MAPQNIFPPPPPPPPKKEPEPAPHDHHGGRGRGRGGQPRGNSRGGFRGRGFDRGRGSHNIRHDIYNRPDQTNHQYSQQQNNFGFNAEAAPFQSTAQYNQPMTPYSFGQAFVAQAFARAAYGGPYQQNGYASEYQPYAQSQYNNSENRVSLPSKPQTYERKRKHYDVDDTELTVSPEPPSVPTFGAPLPGQPPSPRPASQRVNPHTKPPKHFHDPSKKKKSNALGLTPSGAEREETPDDANEEAEFAKKFSGTLKVEYKGKVISLATPEDLKAWIEERKKRWPTKARVEERKRQLVEARKAELAERESKRGGRGGRGGRGERGARGKKKNRGRMRVGGEGDELNTGTWDDFDIKKEDVDKHSKVDRGLKPLTSRAADQAARPKLRSTDKPAIQALEAKARALGYSLVKDEAPAVQIKKELKDESDASTSSSSISTTSSESTDSSDEDEEAVAAPLSPVMPTAAIAEVGLKLEDGKEDMQHTEDKPKSRGKGRTRPHPNRERERHQQVHNGSMSLRRRLMERDEEQDLGLVEQTIDFLGEWFERETE